MPKSTPHLSLLFPPAQFQSIIPPELHATWFHVSPARGGGLNFLHQFPLPSKKLSGTCVCARERECLFGQSLFSHLINRTSLTVYFRRSYRPSLIKFSLVAREVSGNEDKTDVNLAAV